MVSGTAFCTTRPNPNHRSPESHHLHVPRVFVARMQAERRRAKVDES